MTIREMVQGYLDTKEKPGHPYVIEDMFISKAYGYGSFKIFAIGDDREYYVTYHVVTPMHLGVDDIYVIDSIETKFL